MRYFTICWEKYFVFSGRACRSEFWFYHLIYFFIAQVLAMLACIAYARKQVGYEFLVILCLIFVVLGFSPGISVAFRRLHDIGRKGNDVIIFGLYPFLAWFLVTTFSVIYAMHASGPPGLFGQIPFFLGILIFILAILTLVGCITLLVFFCKDSQPGANKYGPNPKESPLPSPQEDNIMESSDIFCPHCGCRQKFAEAKFCSACGGALESEMKKNNPTPIAPVAAQNPKRLIGILFGKSGLVWIILIGALVWLFASNWRGRDKDDLARQVQASMQRKFDNDPDYREYGKITVEKVSLTKSAAHQYKGIATMRSGNKSYDIPVDVDEDKDSLRWSIQSFGLARLGMDAFGNATGDNTEQLLKTHVSVTMGTFSISSGGFGSFDTKLPVTIKNISNKTASYFITIAAIDAAGNQLDTDVVSVEDLSVGQSTQKDIFDFVPSEKIAAFRAATFKITRVQMM